MKFAKKLKNIKLLALDVDGTLTDNRVWMTDSGEWRRAFSIQDGYGLVRLKEAGLELALMTGSKARDIDERARILGVKYYHPGNIDKLSALQSILRESGLRAEQVAYMGDDLFDIPVLKQVGFSATAPEALPAVFKVVDYVTKRSAGQGSVREVCEMILAAKKLA